MKDEKSTAGGSAPCRTLTTLKTNLHVKKARYQDRPDECQQCRALEGHGRSMNAWQPLTQLEWRGISPGGDEPRQSTPTDPYAQYPAVGAIARCYANGSCHLWTGLLIQTKFGI